jgi:hypothetical protein
MQLTITQLQALKAAIAAETNPTFVALRNANNEDGMAAWLNGPSAVYCWRTNVSRSEIYHTTSGEATTWNWTTYKQQSVTEQGAWVQMFMGDLADFSQANLRAGVAAIFGAGNAQTTHVLAIGKRLATLGEKVFATGTGTVQTPAIFGPQGALTPQNISDALGS